MSFYLSPSVMCGNLIFPPLQSRLIWIKGIHLWIINTLFAFFFDLMKKQVEVWKHVCFFSKGIVWCDHVNDIRCQWSGVMLWKVQGVDEANIQPSQVFVCLNSPFSLNLLFTTSIKVAQTCLLLIINPHKKLYITQILQCEKLNQRNVFA